MTENGGGPEAGGGPGAGPPPAAGGSGRRGRGSLTVELGAELRAIRTDLTATSATARSTAGEVSEILPRLEGVETTLDEVTGALRDLLSTDPPTAAGDPPAATPAMGWAEMSEDDAAAAWQALARWVGETLCGSYRTSRDRLPDCWPVHPGAVLELAWLRTLYLATAQTAGKNPAAVAEWHVRWYPAALVNLGTTIDPRECGPGRHRLTDDEHTSHQRARDRATREHQPTPALTAETGADRPRLVPEHAPPARNGADPTTRSDRDQDRDSGPPAGPSEPRFWLPYYRDAVTDDLAHRRRTDAAATATAPADRV